MLLRRATIVGVAAIASVALAAGPASAHFCYKNDVNPNAAKGMAGSANWIPFSQYAADATGLCDVGIEMVAEAAGVTLDTLINGHGIMAGPTDGNKAISHLDFEAVFGALPGAFEACGMEMPTDL